MGGEVDARLLEFVAERAGIGVARFDTVGNQDNGGLVLGITQRLGRLAHRIGERRLAEKLHLGRRSRDGIGGARGRFDNQFDVGAASLLPVAVGHQAEFAVGRDCRQYGA